MDKLEHQVITNFYLTSNFPCSYFKNRNARSVVAMPISHLSPNEFGNLIAQGFRRSGYYIYRPQCQNCRECVPVRICVDGFKLNRSQKKNLQKFSHLQISTKELVFDPEYFAIYKKYQQHRHSGGAMAQDTPEHYQQFFLETLVDSVLIEFVGDGQIKIVSLIDYTNDGISAVYTFFDIDENSESTKNSGLGIYAILWQIEYAKKLNLKYVYLGYWIKACDKMNYKEKFQPLEWFDGSIWHNWQDTQPQ